MIVLFRKKEWSLGKYHLGRKILVDHSPHESFLSSRTGSLSDANIFSFVFFKGDASIGDARSYIAAFSSKVVDRTK